MRATIDQVSAESERSAGRIAGAAEAISRPNNPAATAAASLFMITVSAWIVSPFASRTPEARPPLTSTCATLHP